MVDAETTLMHSEHFKVTDKLPIKETNLIEERAYFLNQDIGPISSIKKTDKTNEIIDNKQNQKERNMYSCNVCGKQFSFKSSLNTHKSSIHDGIKYPCTQCSHTSTNIGNLRRHTKSIHDGIKYPCNDCHLEFTQSSSLHMHIMKVHKSN